MRIEDIDKNFAKESLNGIDFVFMPAYQKPIELDGLPFFEKEGKYCRLPEGALKRQNEGVQALAWNTAGAQLRFRTNSPVIAIKVQLLGPVAMSHMPLSGNSGFDVYFGQGTAKRFYKAVMPGVGQEEYTGLLLDARHLSANTPETPALDYIPGTGMREATINFPLYNGVKSVEIGLAPGAEVAAPTPFAIEKPIVFYGSSITQGGCASRPGNCFIQHLSRRLDANVINYGFSGSARGEEAMAEIIAGFDMSAFVLDYDHNAPNVEHLMKTHEPFFKYIRERHPELPVIFVTKPDIDNALVVSQKRLEVVKATYDKAVAGGDRHVFFVDGRTLFGITDRDACTVDGCHPNDLGFLRMADAIEPLLRKALAGKA